MKNLLLPMSLALMTSVSAHAAKFKAIKSMSNASLDLSRTHYKTLGKAIQKVEDRLTEISSSSFAVTRAIGEKDLNTAKQLLISKFSIPSDESKSIVEQSCVGKSVSTYLMRDQNYNEYYIDYSAHSAAEIKPIEDARKSFAWAIDTAEKSMGSKVSCFASVHSDEDGTWNLMAIIDAANEQVIVFQLGYSGT